MNRDHLVLIARNLRDAGWRRAARRLVDEEALPIRRRDRGQSFVVVTSDETGGLYAVLETPYSVTPICDITNIYQYRPDYERGGATSYTGPALDAQVRLDVNSEDRDRWRTRARDAGVSLNEWIRATCNRASGPTTR